MNYILLDIGYQVISNGQVIRYADLDGNTITMPSGYGGSVIDPNPPNPYWHVEPIVPVEPVYIPPVREITLLAFRDRLTQEEKRAIYTAAKDNIDVQIWIDDLNSVQGGIVSLDDPRILFGLTALLGEARAVEIVNA